MHLRTLIPFMLFALVIGSSRASYDFAPQDLELDGKIINYYEVVSEDFGKIQLASRGSELRPNEGIFNSFMSPISRFNYRTNNQTKNLWRPLPHRISIDGSNSATISINKINTEIDFDSIMGELYFDERDINDALAFNYRMHFAQIFNNNRGPGGDSQIWLSNMVCKSIALTKDNEGKSIRKGLCCSIDFIFDGRTSVFPISTFR